MKRTLWLAMGTALVLALAASAEDLSLEQQTDLIQRYMYVTGQTEALPASLADPVTGEPLHVKCGTPTVLEFQRNRDRLDRRLMASLGVEDAARPVRDVSYGVPGGYTLIHYDTAGIHVPWNAGVDADGDDVPDYVESVALIADSCWVHMIQTLGLPRPLMDSVCLNGGDERLDIYMSALREGLYGVTYGELGCSGTTSQHVSAFITIDHDFRNLPAYVGRPLDGARVTLAHEMFHAVHFALDITEHVTWMEMSAVWMEEEIYDELNDYYLFDEEFFSNTRAALQDTVLSFHMYQAAVFPIYLTERYGRDMVKAIWRHAEELGVGYDYLEAINEVVDSASQDVANARYRCLCYDEDGVQCLDSALIREDLASALTEFAIWNFFTGPYAAQAPNGIGYSEAAYYTYIPLDSVDRRVTYPSRTIGDPTLLPATNGAAYIRLENLQSVDFDSLLTMYITPDPTAAVRWGVAAILQMENDPDSHVVASTVVNDWHTWFCTDSVCDSTVGSDCVRWACTDSASYPGRFLEDMLGEWVCTDGQFGTTIPCGPSTCADSVGVIDRRPLRSVTLVMTPTTMSFGPYAFGNPVAINFTIFDSSKVDQSLVNLSPAVLTPYPNPAVVSEMDGQDLRFRFCVETDSLTLAAVSDPILQLDIFSVAGELVRTLEYGYGEDRYGPRPGGGFEVGWDMKNQAGKDVASGVYLVVARLFDSGRQKTQLVEQQVKVAVIR